MSLTKAPLRHRWHTVFGLPRKTLRPWHRARIREEFQERSEARSCLLRLSETADVVFSISRARHDGFPIAPLSAFRSNALVYAYVVAKFSLRWGFYRVAASLCGRVWRGPVREVINPARDSKLADVAARQGVDVERFVRVARRLRWVWPLLPRRGSDSWIGLSPDSGIKVRCATPIRCLTTSAMSRSAHNIAILRAIGCTAKPCRHWYTRKE